MFNSRRGPIVLFILPVVPGGDEEAEMKVEVVTPTTTTEVFSFFFFSFSRPRRLSFTASLTAIARSLIKLRHFKVKNNQL